MNKVVMALVISALLLNSAFVYSQPRMPSSMDGLFLVYPSGSITSFATQSLFIISVTHEYYVYSRSGKSGKVGKVRLTNGDTLVIEDIIRGEAYQNLLRKSRNYKKCGLIYGVPVKFKIKPVLNRKTKQYYNDRWELVQSSVSCLTTNVRHHSDGDWCKSTCLEWNKGYEPSYKGMRLYANKSDAVNDSKKR